MRVSRPGQGNATPNMTPFIDMMFILVVFFIATSRFHEAERDESIRLAQSKSSLPINTVSDLLVINIDREGQKIVDGRPRELKELERIVRERHQAKPDSEVVVRADTRGLVGPLAETIELCVRLGFKTPSISYQQAGP
ncbi:MAG: biopolymer transporter ExbD [Planctomycetes bacterium]|nr:biopolymer transporter ExbD [Planctomycetota bacterium]